MNKPQWVTLSVTIILVAVLFFATKDSIFGYHPQPVTASAASSKPALTTDTILHHAKETLKEDQLLRLQMLESSITRGNVLDQKIKALHQLAHFWGDTARIFEPYGWYTAEAARLENSEKNLTFAARLFLESLKQEGNQQLKQWKAIQAKDLYERSLNINPHNDSAKVELGVVYVYGGIAMPMEGITMIRSVAENDATNIYAQVTLGAASMVSGQYDKAIERFLLVLKQQPDNLEALLMLADVYERQNNKSEAIKWYRASLPHITIPGLRLEVEKRIKELST